MLALRRTTSPFGTSSTWPTRLFAGPDSAMASRKPVHAFADAASTWVERAQSMRVYSGACPLWGVGRCVVVRRPGNADFARTVPDGDARHDEGSGGGDARQAAPGQAGSSITTHGVELQRDRSSDRGVGLQWRICDVSARVGDGIDAWPGSRTHTIVSSRVFELLTSVRITWWCGVAKTRSTSAFRDWSRENPPQP